MEANRRALSRENERERWGPFPLVVAGAVATVLVILLVDPRWGGFALGGVLMIAAALRFAGYDGQLAVRSKKMDVITLTAFGFLLALTSLALYNNAFKAWLLSLLAG
ncbi:DUF3017 domain-containing protein [Nonomuraea sp. WAC 01424]|uniref:DUF3017 domain-containing protein n=1 Tax=Nonomuraea sp. WAC 01424 TaxID=2203200 RepID=UPI0028989558|nr:DUF3017 domain-containing protein [Nonomuraea sp. WAC 01424]